MDMRSLGWKLSAIAAIVVLVTVSAARADDGDSDEGRHPRTELPLPPAQTIAQPSPKTDPRTLTPQTLSTVDLSKYNDQELAQIVRDWTPKLKGYKPPTEFRLEAYRSGQGDFQDTAYGIARILARLHDSKRREDENEGIKYPGLLENLSNTVRGMQAGPLDDPKNRPFLKHGGSAAERTLEWYITEAMTESGEKLNGNLTPAQTVQKALQNSSAWVYSKENLPQFKDAEAIGGSWNFAFRSMQALAYADGIAALRKTATTDEDRRALADIEKTAKGIFADWFNHDYVKGGQVDPLSNQVFKWGEIYSLRLARTMLEDESLRGFLPEAMRTPDALRKLQTRLGTDLASRLDAISQDPKSERAFGGSNGHTALVAAALSSLPDADRAKALTEKFQKIMTAGGAAGGILPYAPHRQLAINETERSSAARTVGFAATRFEKIGDTAENRAYLVKSLENFLIYSGSLNLNIPRGGVHAGSDQLAPYYYSPEVIEAARAAHLLDGNPNLTAAQQTTLSTVIDRFDRLVASQFTPEGRFNSPGKDTYQWGGRTFTTSAGIIALASAGRGRSSASREVASAGSASEPKAVARSVGGPASGHGADKTVPVPVPPPPAQSSGGPGEGLNEKGLYEIAGQDLKAARTLDDVRQAVSSIEFLAKSDLVVRKSVSEQMALLGLTPADAVYPTVFAMLSGSSNSGAVRPDDISKLIELRKYGTKKRDDALSGPTSEAAGKSLEAIAAAPENRDWVALLRQMKPLSFSSESALLEAMQRRQVLGDPTSTAAESVLQRMASEMYSLTPARRDEIAQRLARIQPASDRDRNVLTALKAIYASGTGSANLGAESSASVPLVVRATAAVDAAKQKALDWNRQLGSVFGADGNINLGAKVSVPMADGRREEISAAEWIRRQKAHFGEDNLVRFAAEVQGDVGQRAMKLVLDGNSQLFVQVDSRQTFGRPVVKDYGLKTGDAIDVSGNNGLATVRSILSAVGTAGADLQLGGSRSGAPVTADNRILSWNGNSVSLMVAQLPAPPAEAPVPPAPVPEPPISARIPARAVPVPPMPVRSPIGSAGVGAGTESLPLPPSGLAANPGAGMTGGAFSAVTPALASMPGPAAPSLASTKLSASSPNVISTVPSSGSLTSSSDADVGPFRRLLRRVRNRRRTASSDSSWRTAGGSFAGETSAGSNP